VKQRLLVMNGQRLVQSEQGSEWNTEKVEKACALKPGIYNIYLASPADKGTATDGPIVHVDKDHVYQQAGKGYIKHSRAEFDKVPDIGSSLKVSYTNGRTVVAPSSTKLGRRIS
jgi:hypothetical protein